MSDLTPAEERDNIIRLLRAAAADYQTATMGPAVCARVADLIEGCPEEVRAARLDTYSTVMRELADEIELISQDPKGVIVLLEPDTYRTLMKNRSEPAT